MMNLTKAQRKALKQIYLRHIIRATRSGDRTGRIPAYREFRRTVTPLLCGNGCAMVHAGGMWLGIETDGYTHS